MAERWLRDSGRYQRGGDYHKVLNAILELSMLSTQLTDSEERKKVSGLRDAMTIDLERIKSQDLRRDGLEMTESKWLELYRLSREHNWEEW